MTEFFSNSELIDLIGKVEGGERLDFADGVRLFNSDDLLAIGFMADLVRRRKNGKKVYFEGAGEPEISGMPQVLDTEIKATMLYEKMESAEERVNQLLGLRELQDEKGSFLTFLPRACLRETTPENQVSASETTGFEDIKLLSIARILLDNFTHIEVSGVEIGLKLAQVSLGFGVDDLGKETNKVLTREELVKLIKAAGYEPVERDRLYKVIKEY